MLQEHVHAAAAPGSSHCGIIKPSQSSLVTVTKNHELCACKQPALTSRGSGTWEAQHGE